MVILETEHSLLNTLVGKKLSIHQLEEILFHLGFDLESVEGDTLKIDITAERPDLLSTQGLARALRYYLGLKVEPYKFLKSKNKVFVKNPAKEWQYVVACIVKGLTFDGKKIKEIIRSQEKIGETFLRKRRKGGLGIYPLKKIIFPITFTADFPKKIVFRPLGLTREMNALELLEEHPTGRRHKHILEKNKKHWERFPLFIDANNHVLSLPPIINSHDLGKIDEKTKEVFVECTGTDLKIINLALEVLVGVLLDMGGTAFTVDILYGGKKVITPHFAEEHRDIEVGFVNKILGTSFKALEIKNLLEKTGYSVKSVHKNLLAFTVPGTRSDIWHDVDIVDDIARAYGFNSFKPTLKPVNTIGGTTRSVHVKEELSRLMLGLGFQEVFTLILTNKQDQFENMNISPFNHMDLGTSVEQSINMARVWLLPEVLKCLKNNRTASYPQRLFEINYVVVPDQSKDVKCKNVLKLVVVSCHTHAYFTEIKQVLEVFINSLDLEYEIMSVAHASFIPGRVGCARIKRKDIAFLGEIHPQVLENLGLEMPVVALELNLTELFDL